MSTEYHKIQTLWRRNPENNHRTLIRDAWATPEFELLRDAMWVFEEKVDGTNIRIEIKPGHTPVIKGRTERAMIPASLCEVLHEIGQRATDVLDAEMTLYGEGFGAKIQKGGGNYKADGVDFALFDVRCGGLWLQREDVVSIAEKIGVLRAPTVNYGTLREAIRYASFGFHSNWGTFRAEGLIVRPVVELQNRRGNRIIGKIKCKDFD